MSRRLIDSKAKIPGDDLPPPRVQEPRGFAQGYVLLPSYLCGHERDKKLMRVDVTIRMLMMVVVVVVSSPGEHTSHLAGHVIAMSPAQSAYSLSSLSAPEHLPQIERFAQLSAHPRVVGIHRRTVLACGPEMESMVG